MKELSVVITVKDEEENIKPLLQAVRAALDGIDYEVVLVDDGSVDKTRFEILENADERTMLVELRKNYGQSTAMTAGIDYSRGRYIALLDGDLQNDPTDIPPMLDLLKREDWDVVAGNVILVVIALSAIVSRPNCFEKIAPPPLPTPAAPFVSLMPLSETSVVLDAIPARWSRLNLNCCPHRTAETAAVSASMRSGFIVLFPG